MKLCRKRVNKCYKDFNEIKKIIEGEQQDNQIKDSMVKKKSTNNKRTC